MDITVNSHELLKNLKGRLQNGIEHWERGVLESAIAIFMLRETGVWELDMDDDGVSWEGRLWNDYIVWLSRSMDFKRTMLLEFVSALRLLTGPSLNFSLNDIEESCIDLRPVVELKRGLDYHTKTGEIRDVKDDGVLERLPPGDSLEEQVRKFVLETHALPNPEERMGRVKDVVSGEQPQKIFYFLEGPDHQGSHWIRWRYNGKTGVFGHDPTPSYILDDIHHSKIRVTVVD